MLLKPGEFSEFVKSAGLLDFGTRAAKTLGTGALNMVRGGVPIIGAQDLASWAGEEDLSKDQAAVSQLGATFLPWLTSKLVTIPGVGAALGMYGAGLAARKGSDWGDNPKASFLGIPGSWLGAPGTSGPIGREAAGPRMQPKPNPKATKGLLGEPLNLRPTF